MARVILLLFILLFPSKSVAADIFYDFLSPDNAFSGGLTIKENRGSNILIYINTVNKSRLSVCEYDGDCVRVRANVYECSDDHSKIVIKKSDNILNVDGYVEEGIFCGQGVGFLGDYLKRDFKKSEYEYTKILSESDDLQQIDKKLNDRWKRVIKRVNSNLKKIY